MRRRLTPPRGGTQAGLHAMRYAILRRITLLFSGRATTCDARRRRAHVDVSRSAATACYVRLPPNLPNRDFFGLR